MKTPNYIKSKINRNLYLQENHPICIIKEKIYEYFGEEVSKIENFPIQVNTKKNFDDLLIEKNHPSRSKSDTYYIDEENVLRTHMTCHVGDILQNLKNNNKFLFTGDVYRKDEIDSTHFPVFHQMDGLFLLDKNIDALSDLKEKITGLINFLFPNHEFEFKKEFYPFNSIAFEVNVKYKDRWIEVLGCGIKREEILKNFEVFDKNAWGFGIGIDRLAMIFFDIPDIRLLWSEDERFIKQFKKGQITKFKPFSKHNTISLDISFYHDNLFSLNDVYDIFREQSDEFIESVDLIDSFFSKRNNLESKTFRVCFSSNDRNITKEESLMMLDKIKKELEKIKNLKIR